MPDRRILRILTAAVSVAVCSVISVAATAAAPATGGTATVSHPDAQHGRIASTIALTVASATSKEGNAVLLQATVDGNAGAAPGGSVVFRAQGKTIGEVAVANGSAALTINALPAGLSTLSASYQGDSTFLPSQSAVVRYYNDDGN